MGLGLLELGQQTQKLFRHVPASGDRHEDIYGNVLVIQKNQKQPSVHQQWGRFINWGLVTQ